ncbi:oxalate--coa ligase-like [Plakobranchus ocellatus]|uniref:Oxalate--coa ligase-like n=1 Tax=Plakobranchus ocellatus TaxID=259542 RepID=A0AAV3YGB6_9GAST|nr:oxalate--coa ligase-like [Plakobranchus ocellatus]
MLTYCFSNRNSILIGGGLFAKPTPDRGVRDLLSTLWNLTLRVFIKFDTATRFAYILKRSGIGYKDAVVNTLPNSLERVVTDMGIILVGAAPVNSIPALTSGEIFFSTARRSEAKAVIVSPSAPGNSDWALIKDGISGQYSGERQENGRNAMEVESQQEEASNGSKTLHDSKYRKFVLEYRSEQAPEMTKAIVISRNSTWQQQEIRGVPHFMDYLASMSQDEELVERAVVSSDIGYYHTTTGTTGMQKIVPRQHSALLKVAETVGQMAPCRLPSLFVTINLGWNSGFPFMFFHFGSTCVMIDDLDFGDGLIGKNERKEILKNGTTKNQTNETHNAARLGSVDKTKNGFGEKAVIEKGKNDTRNGHSTSTSINTKNGVCGFSLHEVYWHAIHTENVMFAHLSPSQIDSLAHVNEAAVREGRQPYDLLAFVVTGGLPVKQSIVAAALDNVCRNIVVFYGLTETGVVSYNVVDDADTYTEGDCGRLYRGVECRITDDDGSVLPPGQTGNVEFKTESIFQGFLKNVEKTKEAFTPDGWFVTADLGYFKHDGTLAVRCRKDDVILHGSVLVYPTAVEMVLRRCVGVKDVVVVPVPDKLKHHSICACVIRTGEKKISESDLKRNMDELIAYPRNVEIPTPQHVIFLESFPLVQNAKVDRKLLAEIAAKSVHCES